MKPAYQVWRVFSPVAMHFFIAQFVAQLFFAVLVIVKGYPMEVYYRYVTEATGITAILAGAAALWLYRRDHALRCAVGVVSYNKKKLKIWEGLLLLVIGAAAGYFFNVVINLFNQFLNSTEYGETMGLITNGKHILVLLLWMGIVVPVGEELIFRWLVYLRLRDWIGFPVAILISGAVFGIYHGNILQGLYAGVLGIMFAGAIEVTGSRFSCIWLHIGANVWVLLFSFYRIRWLEKSPEILLVCFWVLMASLFAGILYFWKRGKDLGRS